jgi:hypothetical protein
MMKLKIFAMLAVFLAFSAGLSAQDKALLLNGTVVEGKITGNDDAYLTMEIEKKSGKLKSFELEKYRVYSYTQCNAEPKTIYKQDSLMGNFLSEEEMQYFIYGQQDADRAFNSRGAIAVGFVTGVAVVGLTTDGFKSDPGILPLATPFLVVGYYGMRKVKIKMETVSNPEYLSHEAYIDGYVRVARKKRVFAGLKGSIAGVVGGFIAAIALSSSSTTE